MSLRELISGPPRYDAAVSAGPAWYVVPTTGLILISSQLIAVALFSGLDRIGWLAMPGPQLGSPPAQSGMTRFFMQFALVTQVAMILLTLAVSWRRGWVSSLKLGRPFGGGVACLWALVLMVPVLGLFNLAAYAIAPHSMAQDFESIRALARSSAAVPTALVIGVGAPISEELLFRGFLVSSLAATRIGFWPAALLANVGWTLLHLNYSWVGMAEVFMIGLFFAWLLWKTGSLWPALICHATYNSTLLVALRYWGN